VGEGAVILRSAVLQQAPGTTVTRREPMPWAPAAVTAGPQRPLWEATALWFLTALAVLTGWFLLYAFVLSGYQEHSAQDALYAKLRNQLALGVAPLGRKISLGDPVAVLVVPQAGVNAVVVDGTTAGLLEHGPGLKADTPLPGEAGTSIIYGRSTLFGGPFRHLSALTPGDVLQVTTGQGTFHYRVHDVRYSGGPEPPPLAAGQGRLTLTTTAGSGWRSLGAPDRYLFVDATLVGKPAATPAGMPTAIPANQRPMQGDPGALIALVFWLQLLLLVVLALIWVRSRWGARLTWLIGAPLMLAMAWVVSEVAFQLLPNLI
jgi:sortase A